MVNSTWRFILSIVPRFVFVFFTPSSTAITSRGEERTGTIVYAFRAFVCLRVLACVSYTSCWCKGLTANCDCGTPLTFILPFFGLAGWLDYFLFAYAWMTRVPVAPFNPYPAVHDISYFCKQYRSRSDGFWRSHLIRIYTVCHSVCEFQQKRYIM